MNHELQEYELVNLDRDSFEITEVLAPLIDHHHRGAPETPAAPATPGFDIRLFLKLKPRKQAPSFSRKWKKKRKFPLRVFFPDELTIPTPDMLELLDMLDSLNALELFFRTG